MTKVMHTWRGK
jgi:hypothetical protein